MAGDGRRVVVNAEVVTFAWSINGVADAEASGTFALTVADVSSLM